MKKAIYLMGIVATIGMVSCSEATADRGYEDRTDLAGPDTNEPTEDPTVQNDTTANDSGIDSTDVVPEPTAVAPEEVSTRLK